ncbi:MAG TPA: cytochrome P450 [Archangium sp.]|jgi:cytochrome P450|uniref:cytochrome P450 n=1 Tax=Archangium sp. TaxID=1872627 RepID=UPI002ED8512F
MPPSISAPLPPGPKGIWFLGNALEQLRDPLGIFARGCERYGDIVHYGMGPGGTIILLNHPDYVKHVLVNNPQNYVKPFQGGKLLGNGLFSSQGDFWKRQRRMMQPAFHRARLAPMVEKAVEGTRSMLTRLEAQARSAKPFDVEQEMTWVLRSIVSQSVFSLDITELSPTVRDAFEFVMAFGRRKISIWTVLPLPRPGRRRYKKSIEILENAVYELVRQRMRTPGEHQDQLSAMVAARDTQGEPMTDKQLRDEAMTLLVAGHEATVSAMTWVWYLLDRHPEVQRKVREELATVLGDAPPTAQTLPQLQYTSQVFAEALRLYPPAWVMGRLAKEEDQIGGYTIPAKCTVVFSQYVMHRHPTYWEDPERFDPERFAPERKGSQPRYAYFPFGGGQRLCIGDSLAELHALVVMATVLQRYRLELEPGFRVEPEAGVTLRPANGLRVIAHPDPLAVTTRRVAGV